MKPMTKAGEGTVSVWPSLRRSWGLLAARPVVMLSLGAAVVLSLLSVCCGIGVFTAPWFLCELSAVQLAEGRGVPVARSRSWFGAATVLAGAVLLTSSVAWLSLLGLGADRSAATPPAAPPDVSELLGGGGLFALGAALIALVFVLPFLYAALILIEGRTTLGGAALESARLVARGGALAHLKLTLAAHAVQVAPLLLGALWAAGDPPLGTFALAMLAALPLLALSVPLGQGMIASAYLERRDEVVETAQTRPEGRPPRALVWLWAALVVAPLASFGALGASLVTPSRLQPGALPDDVELLGSAPLAREPLHVRPQGTALRISATARHVEVVASDGGGAGRLPLRGHGVLEQARVARSRAAYGIEVTRGGQTYLTWIDAAGVRLDDGLRARLADRAPLWVLLVMLGSLLATASLLLPALLGLSEVRRVHALPDARRPPTQVLAAQRTAAVRRAALAAALLLPASAFAAYWGARALLGGA